MQHLLFRIFLSLVSFFLLGYSKVHAVSVAPQASNQKWPQIVHGDCYGDAEEILEFARDIYNSKIFTWHDALPCDQMEIKDGYEVMLSPLEGGHLYYEDKDLINHYKIGYLEFWWPKNLKEKNVFFITQSPSYSCGDINQLHLIESSQMLSMQEDIYKSSEEAKHVQSYNIENLQNVLLEKIYLIKSVKNIYGGNILQKPWLIKTPNNKSIFAINVGYAHEFLPDWKVYASYENQKEHYIPICQVRFRSPKVRDAKSLLPNGKIRELGQLLDTIIGSAAKCEGCSQQSRKFRDHLGQTLKDHINHAWANLSLRPQALASREPYNSTAEVVYGLKKWANKSIWNFEQFNKLKKIYPIVLKELSSYYHESFNFQKEEADLMAKKNIDLAFRSYFWFIPATYDIAREDSSKVKNQVYVLSELIREAALKNDFAKIYEHANVPVTFFVANYPKYHRQQDYNLIARDFKEFEEYFKFVLNDDEGAIDRLQQQTYTLKWRRGLGAVGLSCLNHTIWIKAICTATPDFAKTEWWKSSEPIELCSSINMKIDWVKLK